MARTQKERRAESDSRIIESAIVSFGKNGYTHSTLNNIAKTAGVTGGLVVQRFESKEKLYDIAYDTVVRELEAKADDIAQLQRDGKADAVTFLKAFIKLIKQFRESNPDEFLFLKTFLNNIDVLDDYVNEKKRSYVQSTFYMALQDAQKKKMLPDCKLDVLILSFFVTLFNQIDICFNYNIDIPEDRFFLNAIQFKDIEKEKRIKQNETMISALVNLFDGFAYCRLYDNTVDIIKTLDFDGPYLREDDALATAAQYIEKNIAEADCEKITRFLDVNTFDERIGMGKMISCRSKTKADADLLHCLIPLKRDESGKITEILYGIQID